MRRNFRYMAALWTAVCLGAGAPGAAYAQETAAAGEQTGTVRYEQGSYVVGRDIPAGEYAVFAKPGEDANPYRTCNFTLYKDDSDEKRIGTFSFEHHGLVALYNGQHLKLRSGWAVPASEAGLSLAPYGMYLAGRDMEPGSYLVSPLTSEGGYYALYNDVRYYYDYQDDYRRFLEPTVITVAEGQYLELGNAASIVKLDGGEE